MLVYKFLRNNNLFCTGCGACVNKCPVNAIDYTEDRQREGSLIAEINEACCIQCGLCKTVCPILAGNKQDNLAVPECYAVWAQDDIRYKSSSGGAFTIIANYILDRGGKVCGAAYKNDFTVRHVMISSKNDLDILRRSKYVQSETGYIYRDIKAELEANIPILFVGTPCQVAGLKAYLEKDYDNLILVDFYCNYTPAPFLWKRYLEDNYTRSDIAQIDFRVKKQGWVCDIHEVTYTDGHTVEKRTYNDAFQQGYHSRLFMRTVCENCKFSGRVRQGDFTIGDFWGIDRFAPALDDNKGTSCLLINNPKAKRVLLEIKNQFQKCEEVDYSWTKYNRQEMVTAHPGRDRFYELLNTTSFNQAVDFALNDKYDVVIWGNWSERNYGSELTYYALYKWMESLGLYSLMVERPKEAVWGPNSKAVLFRNNPYAPFSLSTLYPNKMAMSDLNRKTDIFIVGSDQIWHSELYNSFGKVSFLDFISNTKKKIAYASSFGREHWTGGVAETQEVKTYLKDFDYVSVREKSAVKICREVFDRDAQCVLDPVFMCDKEYYIDLSNKSDMFFPENYIGAYILDIDKKKQQLLKCASAKLRLKLNIITDAFEKKEGEIDSEDIMADASVEDWLKNVINSEYFITDSFHGMCFAIIFEKPFIAIINSERGAIRFYDLLSELDLMNRAIDLKTAKDDDYQHLFDEQIDYSKVNDILAQKRMYSGSWLKTALKVPKHIKVTRYDILRELIQKNGLLLENEKNERLWDIKVHRDEINGHLVMISDLQEQAKARLWDIKVHRDELNGHLLMISNLQEQAKARLTDINVHRDEINGHLQMIRELEEQVNQQYKVFSELNRHIDEMDRLTKILNSNIDMLNKNWCIRLSRKISKIVKRMLTIGGEK